MARSGSLQPIREGIETETSEDTLSASVVPMSDERLRELLRSNPARLVRGTGEHLVRPPDRHVTCAASVSDAIIEDRG